MECYLPVRAGLGGKRGLTQMVGPSHSVPALLRHRALRLASGVEGHALRRALAGGPSSEDISLVRGVRSLRFKCPSAGQPVSKPASPAFQNAKGPQTVAMSGPRVEKFTAGWALPIGMRKAHYFTRTEAGAAKSACASLEGPAGRLFNPGSFPQCRRCIARLSRPA